MEALAVAVAVAVVVVVVVLLLLLLLLLLRLMPEILHDFEHPHGSPATPNLNIALTQGLKPRPVRMPKILHDPLVVQR